MLMVILGFIFRDKPQEDDFHSTIPACPEAGEYQILVGMDTVYIYDNNRYVGQIPYSDTDALSQLIVEDNQ